MRSRSRRVLTTILAAIGLFALSAPASAAAQAYPSDYFKHCWINSCSDGNAATEGWITWHNRTATVSGWVSDPSRDGNRWSLVIFEAYAGSTKVDSTLRSANRGGSVGSPFEFEFTIGDTNRRGGIDRIKITPCYDGQPYGLDCVAPINYSRS